MTNKAQITSTLCTQSTGGEPVIILHMEIDDCNSLDTKTQRTLNRYYHSALTPINKNIKIVNKYVSLSLILLWITLSMSNMHTVLNQTWWVQQLSMICFSCIVLIQQDNDYFKHNIHHGTSHPESSMSVQRWTWSFEHISCVFRTGALRCMLQHGKIASILQNCLLPREQALMRSVFQRCVVWSHVTTIGTKQTANWNYSSQPARYSWKWYQSMIQHDMYVRLWNVLFADMYVSQTPYRVQHRVQNRRWLQLHSKSPTRQKWYVSLQWVSNTHWMQQQSSKHMSKSCRRSSKTYRHSQSHACHALQQTDCLYHTFSSNCFHCWSSFMLTNISGGTAYQQSIQYRVGYLWMQNEVLHMFLDWW